MELLLMIILGVIGMPILGVYLLLAGKSSEQRWLGAALLIVGIIVYGKCGLL